MTTRKKPLWRTLTVVGLLGGAGLFFAARLPLGGATQMRVLLLWVGLFYGVVAVWIRGNSAALEGEPPARDSVGRPVIDNGAPVSAAQPPRPQPQPNTAAHPLTQSEAC
jgi:hypothetical protein